MPTDTRVSDLYSSSTRGTIFYSPRNPLDHRRPRPTAPGFPTPHIRPRQRRHHSIHIVSYPPGYVPNELRPVPPPSSSASKPSKRTSGTRKQKKQKQDQRDGSRLHLDARSPIAEADSGSNRPAAGSRVLEKLLSAIASHITPASLPATTTTTPVANTPTSPLPPTTPTTNNNNSNTTTTTSRTALPSPAKPRPTSLLDFGRRLSGRVILPHLTEPDSMIRSPTMLASPRPPLVSSPHLHIHRNSFKSIISSSVAEISNKPVASGSGVSCSILLAEPNVFLTGFDHDGHTRQSSANSSALLRGKLQLNVSKNVKIKSVELKLVGKARTEWPEGIPPLKVELYEEETLRTQALTFFHAMYDTWASEYGNQCTYTLKGAPDNGFTSPTHSAISLPGTRPRTSSNLTAKELKRLSLQSVQSRSFGKGDSPMAHHVQARGYKVFHPGTYEYSFELPIDHHQLETTKLQYGSVKWELQTTIERAGAFKPNLHGSKEVSIVRVPDQLSLETVEPISISRQWEDQLHYDIIISGKSFPIGSKIPIAFKLTPLAKVQVHKLKVFVTESIEYWTNDRHVTRKDPGRKILLIEKSAGKPLDKQYESSEVNVLRGGELTTEQRSEARAAASRRRTMEAERTHTTAQPLPEPTDNILGDLDLGLETFWGATEMEMNVQIPTCEQMAKDKSLRLHPDCSWKNVNVFHWIKIVMRISRLDPDDPAGKRRRHFEISIDSPFTVLNCRATQANTALPQYSSPDMPCGQRYQSACGCPDAAIVATAVSPASSTNTLPMVETDLLPMPPQAAHLGSVMTNSSGSQPGSGASTPTRASSVQRFENARPIHLLRVPSYDPPAFDAERPPPPLMEDIMTPPPNYDAIVGTPSVDGLADYFARLADYEEPPLDVDMETEEDTDSEGDHAPARILTRGGRVNVANPRTPGGRLVPSRSLEIERPVIPLSMAGVVRRT